MTQDAYALALRDLPLAPRRWTITGVAGFIGSNLLEQLLRLGQTVVGLDNFLTGHRSNLEEVRALVGEEAFGRFRLLEGDIRDPAACGEACRDADVVLHQAALGSVPRSLDDPVTTDAINAQGTLNMLVAARDAGVKRFVYASSSAVYGDNPALPKRETEDCRPVSPYAVSKVSNELYARVFSRAYGLETVGLRYFNVFGPRQDPEGPYAAVIPLWFASMLAGRAVYCNGSTEISRDFCFVDNAVQANILAGISENPAGHGRAYNIACGVRRSLGELYVCLRDRLLDLQPALADTAPVVRDYRPGDIPHSLADISRATEDFGYAPRHSLESGLDLAREWYLTHAR
jgi:UDP-N-acetylglucosamine 4-epimerase